MRELGEGHRAMSFTNFILSILATLFAVLGAMMATYIGGYWIVAVFGEFGAFLASIVVMLVSIVYLKVYPS